MSEPSDVVQRARQALDAWPGEPITDDDRKGNAVIGSITVAQYDLVTDLLALVEIALPTITAQRDDALAEVEKLRGEKGAAWLECDEYAYAARKNWAAYQTCEDRAETAEGEAENERGNDDALAGLVVAKRHGKSNPLDQWVHLTVRELVAILRGDRIGDGEP